MKERQNAILQWLSRTIPGLEGDKYLDQKVKNASADLQPTLVLWHRDGRASIANVMIPYEGDKNAFQKVGGEKRMKYRPTADWLVANRQLNVLIDAFIVGLLGAWDVENEDILRRLQTGTKYAVLF